MRDVALVFILLGIVPLIFYRPHVGVLAWAWVSLMNPHKEVYSFLHGANLNLVIALLTIAALAFFREKSLNRLPSSLVVILIFAAWTTLTTFTAINYDLSLEFWSRNIKTFILLVFVVMVIDRPARIHAMILIIIISLGYWGILDGLRTIITFGHSRMTGPSGSMIYDNNALALALVLMLPLVEYCRYVSGRTIVRNACVFSFGLTIIAILGTYSRGGLISLASILTVFLFRSQRRFLAIGLIFMVGALATMLPQKWSDRMATIETFRSDASFQSRVAAWKTAVRIALDRPVFGAGYRATEDPAIYARYKSEGDTTDYRAVHDAYLQVLAEHGFVGLGLFALMFFLAFRDCRWVVRRCSNVVDLYWSAYLASMMEIGFIGYAVGAIALSVAYYDGFLVLIVLSSILRGYTQRELSALENAGKEYPLQRVPGYVGAPSYASLPSAKENGVRPVGVVRKRTAAPAPPQFERHT
jgi:probable O-glycosylation ligase (exosortase A-associated)